MAGTPVPVGSGWITFAVCCLSLVGGASLAASPALTWVFVASDSTAQDYGAEKYPQQGWGAMLRCAFGPDVVVENRAIAARSSRTFIEEGRLAGIARDIRAGDTLLIQFGHNDANRQKPERHVGIDDYKMYLGRFIDTAVQAGAQAVLLTPVTLRHFEGGVIVPAFPDYSAAVRELARTSRTPLIDLDTLSARWVEQAGVEGSRRYFLADDVHFTEPGARGVAGIVAAQLAGLGIPLSARVRPAMDISACM